MLATTQFIRLPAWYPDREEQVTPGEDVIEFAGRTCYRSYAKPNPATAKTEDYLTNIIKQGHLSVLEHASTTFFVEGISRACSHELVRHRHLSFSQVSQRYVDSSEEPFVSHPVLGALDPDALVDSGFRQSELQECYTAVVECLTEMGYSRKEARGAARLLLPEGTTTSLVVTGNWRAWYEFLGKRDSEHADAEICRLAQEIRRQLVELSPTIFTG